MIKLKDFLILSILLSLPLHSFAKDPFAKKDKKPAKGQAPNSRMIPQAIPLTEAEIRAFDAQNSQKKNVNPLDVAIHESLAKAASLNNDSDLTNNVEGNHFFIILAPSQVLYEFNNGQISSYKVSTGANGFGNETNSNKTSTGFMRIFGTVNRGGEKNQYIFSRYNVKDYVFPQVDNCNGGAAMTSRLLLLEGLEGHNINVLDRGIYLHGTNHEPNLGVPKSHGCIRMDNDDVVNLCDRTLSSLPDFTISKDMEKILDKINSNGYLLYIKK